MIVFNTVNNLPPFKLYFILFDEMFLFSFIAYLVSILNLLHKVQSCNDNHLLMGATCAEDTPLMKQYTKHLVEEMELMEGATLKTDQGHVPSFSSKRGHLTEKHVLIGCKHDMFGCQTFEV